MAKTAPYKPHPLADQFPPMPDEEYQALKEDIRRHGQKEPIHLYQGRILDGRHRYTACTELGLKPIVRTLRMSPQQAAQFSVARNLQRRHLTTSQRAMYLVRAGLVQSGPSANGKRRYQTGESAIRRISQRYGVSHVSVYKALFVHRNDPALARKVFTGQISVAEAEKQIRQRRQPDVLAQLREVPRNLQGVFAAARTLADARSRIVRLCAQLPEFKWLAPARLKRLDKHLNLVLAELRSMEPRALCASCAGRGCSTCGQKGWITASDDLSKISHAVH